MTNLTTAPSESRTFESTGDVSVGAEDDELRVQAISSLKRKRKLAEDVVGYFAVNGVLWLIWVITDRSTDGSIPWPAWVSVIWGFLFAIDVWKTYGRWPSSLRRPISEAEIEQEMTRSLKR